MSVPVMKSPGVYITEVDLSAYATIMNTSKIFGVVTVAQNGPIGVVTEIKSVKDFEKVFGNPISAGGIACIKILDQTSSLKVVRVAGSSASKRTVSLPGVDASESPVESALVISAKYAGTLYSDAIKASVSSISDNPDKFTLTITKGDNDVEILKKNYTIVKDNATDEYPYIIADDSTDFEFTLGSSSATVASIKPTDDAVEFSIGDNGDEYTDNEVKTAIDAFDDAENIDLDILAAPGMYNATVIDKLITVATSRKDTVAIIDPPQGLTPQEMADFVDGKSEKFPGSKLDSTYAATYYPWGRVYNQYTGVSEWMPPSVGMLSAMAAEYSNYDAWATPAGISNLEVGVFSEMERVLNQKDRDILYPSHVNPICNYKSLGMTAFGQKTLQRSRTATDRLNVRFLVNYIKKLAQFSTIPFLFQEINDVTFDSWTERISSQLADIQSRGGLYEFKVTMDWSTVTDEMLNNNIMPGIIQIKPTKVAEFIPIDVVIRNKSDDFE